LVIEVYEIQETDAFPGNPSQEELLDGVSTGSAKRGSLLERFKVGNY
jgi:hypothetical protein